MSKNHFPGFCRGVQPVGWCATRQCALFRNQNTFLSSQPSIGLSKNLHGTDKGNHSALKSRIPLMNESQHFQSITDNEYRLKGRTPFKIARCNISGRQSDSTWSSQQRGAEGPHLHATETRPVGCNGRRHQSRTSRGRSRRDRVLPSEWFHPRNRGRPVPCREG